MITQGRAEFPGVFSDRSHGGLWLLAHALLTVMLGRPWFAAAIVSAFLLMLVLVKKYMVELQKRLVSIQLIIITLRTEPV